MRYTYGAAGKQSDPQHLKIDLRIIETALPGAGDILYSYSY